MRNLTDFQLKMADLLPELELRYDESMAKHTSFRIGGPVEVMAFPKTVEELAEVLKVSALLDRKTAILGAGTNVLAPDAGLPGLVICLKDCLGGMEQQDDAHIRVAAGVTMTRAAVFAANLGLSGLEFAHGIPGTVGGGVYMNAGAYGGEICQVCTQVEVMDLAGNLRVYTGEEMNFSYRHSRLEDEGGIVVSAIFTLVPKPTEEIRAVMQDLMGRRSASQPLDLPSAGSAFKRPVGGYAAALIDNAGLKGYRIGNAAVSEKHAGFVINYDNATSEDILKLIEHIKQVIMEKNGLAIQCEVRLIQ